MSRQSAAESQAPESRTIGDILLARGFVTREKLDEALARQQNSGKPLGQILVEEGAISRLELASALAEQWSDIGSVSPEFGSGSDTGSSGSLVELQEMRNSRRVLEERLRAFESGPASLEDVEERARLTARLAGVEAAVAGLQEHDAALEVGRLRQSVAELGARLEAISASMASVTAQLSDDQRIADIDRRLASLGAAVESAFREMERRDDESRDGLAALAEQVGQRPAASDVEALAERVAAFELKFDALASGDRVEELSRSLDALALTIRDAPDSRDDLAEMRRRIDVLVEDAQRFDALVERSATLDAQVAEGFEALESRLADRLAALEERLAESNEALSEHLAAPPPDIPAHDERLPSLVDELTARVDALASRPIADGETDGRVAELAVRLEHLAAAVAAAEPVAPDSAVTERLDELTRAVDEARARPAGDPALTARLDELSARVDELTASRKDGSSEAELAALAARVDELTDRPAESAELRDTIARIAGRVEELAQASAPEIDLTPLNGRLDELARRAEELERHQSQQLARLDELAEREIASDGGAVQQAREAVSAATELAARLDALEQRAAELSSEVRGARDVADARGTDAEARLEGIDARLEELATRLHELPRMSMPMSVSDALAQGGTPREGSEDQDIERLRMMVERLMHDFADHRRAVSSALSSREFTALLEELAARVDELQAGGVVGQTPGGTAPAPAGERNVLALTRRLDEVEDSVRESRDGVFQRLERMMGTIDWRLQRLEHPEHLE